MHVLANGAGRNLRSTITNQQIQNYDTEFRLQRTENDGENYCRQTDHIQSCGVYIVAQ
jgi:hypothetical protein